MSDNEQVLFVSNGRTYKFDKDSTSGIFITELLRMRDEGKFKHLHPKIFTDTILSTVSARPISVISQFLPGITTPENVAITIGEIMAVFGDIHKPSIWFDPYQPEFIVPIIMVENVSKDDKDEFVTIPYLVQEFKKYVDNWRQYVRDTRKHRSVNGQRIYNYMVNKIYRDKKTRTIEQLWEIQNHEEMANNVSHVQWLPREMVDDVISFLDYHPSMRPEFRKK